ncbi:alkylation response protein AidB-like acyl-CoA dehydrogenase [Sphingomonas sp. BE270]|jgi:alkylation response protein AidB-like acyl-CoA dehydrogenase|uniref:acyl-CoA dehydrogenase family protein n=1 Tax=unclassified Sphingomonas TaxID=196159 RepID=UPI00053D3251|nr:MULTISPECIES: acyl-CoA dehydrogenase [unclassified Sphingomonas]MDR6849673.1 alkylation response protein AidB-like acyl-CoA dehydrogenase [Sphingomonas sp. BE137]MDR7258706.1 alkylation response protein AidB-like acyl-CoA dehydrogenase [Sphingomonas sp. BE270]
MPLYLNDDQTALQDTIRDFVADHAPVTHMRALRDSKDAAGFSRDLWKSFAEMGFTGILIDEAEGGLGLGHVEAGVVLEEIGRNLSPSPFLATAVAAVEALKGTAHAARWFPGILAGETVAALAIDEAAKHRDTIGLQAERSGNGFKLTGKKQFVTHGHVADLLIVAARTTGNADDAEGITLFAIPKGAANLTATPERLADASFAARLEFDGVEVDADAVIGEVDHGRSPLDRLLRAGRTGAAAELLGVGGGAMDMTVGYLKERKQFGALIGSFQALQHRAAHLYSEMEVARAAVLKAQQLLDAGSDAADTAVSVAKAMTGMATTLSVQEGVQMHGGIGMTDEYDIGFYMKRARVLAEMFGDANFHADRIARAAGY